MKFIYIAVIAFGALALAKADSSAESSLEEDTLKNGLAGFGQLLSAHLEQHIKSALSGAKVDEEGFKAQLKAYEGGLPILPYPVYIKGNLDTAAIVGLADIIPDIKVDFIRRTLDVNYTIPKLVLEGQYNLLAALSEDFATYNLLSGSGLGEFHFNDIGLTINAKLKGLIVWSIDYLEYNLAPLGVESKLDQLLLFNNVPIAEYVEPVVSWYLHRELVDYEGRLHEPIVQLITDIINKALCPLC